MLKLLPDKFVLDDGKTDGESTYYQEIYIARVMYWDGVYSGQEYKEKVLETLSGLIHAELSEGTVNEKSLKVMPPSSMTSTDWKAWRTIASPPPWRIWRQRWRRCLCWAA